MTIALHGNLRDFGMGEVFQLIGQQRKTGVLEVRGQTGEVTLRFDAGNVVSAAPVGERADAALVDMIARCGLVPRDRLAEIERDHDPALPIARRLVEAGLLGATALREIEDLLTRETIFDLLRWGDGSFRFVAQAIPHDRPADTLLGAEQVLMDGLRMVDEWHAFTDDLPAETAVFRRRGSIEEYRHSTAGRSAPSPMEAERIFLLVDGRATVRRVIDLSRLGTFGAMRILVQLARSGWIEPVRARTTSDARSAAPGRSSPARRWVGFAGPFALLLVVASIAVAGRGGVLRDDAALRDPIADARARLATSAVRALLLAHRVAEGRWPDGLDALARWVDPDAFALTPVERGVYYLEAGQTGPIAGPIVLSPDPSSSSDARSSPDR